jgi:hypothetical protein
MLNSFESRLINMLADGLAQGDLKALVLRPQEALSTLLAEEQGRVLILVQILSAETDSHLGDDALERLGEKGAYQQRPVLYLRGQVAIDLLIARNEESTDDSSRTALLHVLDQTILLLHESKIRQGRGFHIGQGQEREDQGFDLDGFRLVDVLPLPKTLTDVFQQMRLSYDYSGRFWPVEVPADGKMIRHLPTRIVVLPIQIPTGITTHAGNSNVEVPIRLDLRSWEEAPRQLVARLRGAAPLGSLVGDVSDLPAGYAGYLPNVEGDFVVVYRPPADLSSDIQVHIELGLSRPEQSSLSLGELTIGVKRS